MSDRDLFVTLSLDLHVRVVRAAHGEEFVPDTVTKEKHCGFEWLMTAEKLKHTSELRKLITVQDFCCVKGMDEPKSVAYFIYLT